ncbi:MAG: 2,3-bisphosphoglycerate-dependent phosphoglycerate mutase [Asgard group archaeon]|nr:2,3-bisphosphoglycerate-dependent phosphoglycerate mutase [Asgard group archaeon]
MTVHKLIILRHGESQWNHENKFCGWIDIPLSDKGKTEAVYAGELIKQHNLDPDILFTSKLKRSIETGLSILEVLHKPWIDHIKTWRLNERHYGKYQGRDKHEVFLELGKDKEKFQYIRRNYHGLPPLVEIGQDGSIDERYNDIMNKEILPRGESLLMVMERLIPFFKYEILDNEMIQKNKTVLIVTHGSIVRSLIKYLNHVSDDDISKINVPTGIPLVFELNDRGELIKPYYYLDKEKAEKGIAKVKMEGLETNRPQEGKL